MTEVELPGCTPEPLMGYLKALGVFRLVAEQADPAATLHWAGGVAHLTSKYDHDQLTEFFEKQYCPTPIVVPWSGGDFFNVNRNGNAGPFKEAPTAKGIIEAFLATNSSRLEGYRKTLHLVLDVMSDAGVLTKSTIEGASGRHRKAEFLARLRSVVPDDVVPWLDAAAQLVEDGFAFNPLLGSGGGSDGNSHFSDNFMQSLWDCLPDFDTQRSRVRDRPSVRHAIFGELAGVLTEKRTGALFDSGAVGGPNATQGRIRQAMLNPWDFVLGLEGSLTFAGGVAKRLGVFSTEAPAFPFTVEMAAAGFGSAAHKEYGQREVWMPLWVRPLSYGEVTLLMREGRAQVGRRPARNGVDFARAVATLGVSAGTDEFIRYGFIRGRVGGENYYTAAALGRFRVHSDSSLTLLEQIDPWLARLRRACQDDNTPARYSTAIRRLDDAILEYARSRGESSGFQAVLAELGRVERALVVGRGFRSEHRLQPLSGLSPQWLGQADDGSPEFRLAAALAGMRADGEVGPFRVFLEPVASRGDGFAWDDGSTSAVWSNRSLDANLAAVFRRRQMEAFRAGLDRVPLSTPRPAQLPDVLSFLRGETDPDKLHELIWGLAAVNWSEVEFRAPTSEDEPAIPFEFGLPRLLVKPLSLTPSGKCWRMANEDTDHATRHDPDVFHAIAAGRSDATERAGRRLRAGGLNANGYRNRQTNLRHLAVVSPLLRPGQSDRLLAAMMFPLSDRDLLTIANDVLSPPEAEE